MRKQGLLRRVTAVAGVTWLTSQIFLSNSQYIQDDSLRKLAWTTLVTIAIWGVFTLIARRMDTE